LFVLRLERRIPQLDLVAKLNVLDPISMPRPLPKDSKYGVRDILDIFHYFIQPRDPILQVFGL
jgi:hypothetical protein